MPKNKAIAPQLPKIARPRGKLLLRIGPPPVFGKPVTAGTCVAAAFLAVGLIVGVVV
jgi:hypothetical protein